MPFQSQVAKLFSKYDASLTEKLTACMSPDTQQFLKLILSRVKPEDVSLFSGQELLSSHSPDQWPRQVPEDYWKLVMMIYHAQESSSCRERKPHKFLT